LFNISKTYYFRIRLCENKSFYESIVRKKKNLHYRKKMSEIENLKKGKLRDFWKYFKKTLNNFGKKYSGTF
jgi:hypothetical protein